MHKINIWFHRVIRSKTMIFSIILAILGVLQASQDILSTLFTPKDFGLLTIAISVTVAVLRVLTVKPLEEK